MAKKPPKDRTEPSSKNEPPKAEEKIIELTEKESGGSKALVWILTGALLLTWVALGVGAYMIYGKVKQGMDTLDQVQNVVEDVKNFKDVAPKLKDKLDDTISDLRRIDKVEDTVKALKEELPNTTMQFMSDEEREKLSAYKQDVVTILKRLEALEEERKDLVTVAPEREDVFVAMSNFRQALRNGLPYEVDLNVFRKFADSDPVLRGYIDELEPLLQDGVVTLQSLREEFNELAEELPERMETDEDMQGTISFLKDLFGDQVTVKRRVDDMTIGEVMEKVTLVRKMLESGQVERAVEKVATDLLERSDDALGPWVERASWVIQMEAVFAKIVAHLSNKMEAKGLLDPIKPQAPHRRHSPPHEEKQAWDELLELWDEEPSNAPSVRGSI